MLSGRGLLRQRLLIEELLRKRRSDDAERFVELFRRSTIDPNPHQIEAAMFALGRLRSGGALLCDEVGLGKTIEAGLVITQLRAQGQRNILIIVPLSLARQWQVELQDLFSVNSSVINADNLPESARNGVYIVGREAAATARLVEWVKHQRPWDLVIIDEAHEMFATIHSRFNKNTGVYQEDLSRGPARRAACIKGAISGSPILLLTATPLQNNLYELWGLVQYIDPEHQILGKFNEYCALFVTGEGGRAVEKGMEETLRRRLSLVLKRTLRRQAQPFIKQPFRDRLVYTANFNPEKVEADLHRSVSLWLSKEVLAAYRGGHRSLMALQIRRRMASSTEALLSTLQGVQQRMLKIRETGVYPKGADWDEEFEIENIQDDSSSSDSAGAPGSRVDMEKLEEDLREVEKLLKLAAEVVRASSDTKKQKLLEVIKQIQTKSMSGVVSDKVVVFTESVKTLQSLLSSLETNGFAGQVTTFSGTNDGPIGQRALALWEDDIGRYLPTRPEAGAAMRGALIHEFKTKTQILIATEAGAKGLNLQFCNCLVNYDLPWNPQRIEQRIGRVHRYGQKHDVVIVNFINLSNEAEQRVYQLLEQKLNVFTGVLDASDVILNAPEIALNLEHKINEMLNRCRTTEEIEEEFDRLNLEIDREEKSLREEKLSAARRLISDLDRSVQARLGALDEHIGPAMSHCDQILLEILKADAASNNSDFAIEGQQGPRTIISWRGRRYHLGPPEPGEDFGEPLHRSHPEVISAIEQCRNTTNGVTLNLEPAPATGATAKTERKRKRAAGDMKATDNPASLGSSAVTAGKAHQQREGQRWQVYRITLQGLETEERIAIIGERLDDDCFSQVWHNLDEAVSEFKGETERHQKDQIDRLLMQISARREDLNKYDTHEIGLLERKIEAAEKARRTGVTPAAMAQAQSLQTRLRTEMDKLVEQLSSEKQASLARLLESENRVRRLQFVDVATELLFNIELKEPSLLPGNESLV